MAKDSPLPVTTREFGAFALQHALTAYDRGLRVRDPAVNVARIIEAKVGNISRLSSDLRNALSGTTLA